MPVDRRRVSIKPTARAPRTHLIVGAVNDLKSVSITWMNVLG
nr:hypothetical protein [Rhodopirellula sp. SM50]